MALFSSSSKKGAKKKWIKILIGIRVIGLCGEVIIKKYGKISSFYEKKISQESSYSKDFVIDHTKEDLKGAGRSEGVFFSSSPCWRTSHTNIHHQRWYSRSDSNWSDGIWNAQ